MIMSDTTDMTITKSDIVLQSKAERLHSQMFGDAKMAQAKADHDAHFLRYHFCIVRVVGSAATGKGLKPGLHAACVCT